MNKKKIRGQFFINYLLLFVTLIVVVGLIYGLYNSYVDYYFDEEYIDLEKIYNDTVENGINSAIEENNLPEQSYVEYLNEYYIVTESYGSTHEIGYEYSDRELNMLSSGIEQYDYLILYPDETDDFLLFFVPIDNTIPVIMFVFLAIAIVTLLLILIISAKVTSENIVNPVIKLTEGVARIESGDYDYVIDFESQNELGVLRDSVNNMSKTVMGEIIKREKSEESRKKLILDLSHDIKTPLTNVLGYAHTLKDSLESNIEITDEQKIQYLDIVITNGEKANILIGELFELSHLEMDDSKISFENVDICELLRNILINYIDAFEEKRILFEFNIPEVRIYTRISKNGITRVIDNLISNSIKYNEEDFSIIVTLEEDVDNINIIVEDDGVGIDPSLHEEIFNPFIREETSRNRKYGGTGLGLSIAREIVLKHSGTIKLGSNNEAGCKFIITLPKNNPNEI